MVIDVTGHLCFCTMEKVEIWSGVTSRTDSLTLKDRATLAP